MATGGHFDDLELQGSFKKDGSILISNEPKDHVDLLPYPMEEDFDHSSALMNVFMRSDCALRDKDAGAHVYRIALSADKGIMSSETVRKHNKAADHPVATHPAKWVQARTTSGIWLIAATNRTSSCVADIWTELSDALGDSGRPNEVRQLRDEVGDSKAPLHEIFQNLPLPDAATTVGYMSGGVYLFNPVANDGLRWRPLSLWLEDKWLENYQKSKTRNRGQTRLRRLDNVWGSVASTD